MEMPAIPQTGAQKTSFSRDITMLRNYVDGTPAPPEHLAGWVGKVKALHARYNSPTAPPMATRPRVVISGAGPMGLLTAVLLLVKRGGYDRITILEKTDGKDTRWNTIMAQDEASSMLTLALGLFSVNKEGETVWIGEVAQLEYVLGATLLAIGVEIKYNTMFIFACPNATHNSAVVHTVDTPEDRTERNRTFDTDPFCTYTGDELARALGPRMQGHVVETNVRVLIGADGTRSSVRRSTLHGQSGETDSSFPVRSSARATLIGANNGAGPPLQAEPVELYSAGRTADPLLTHLMVSFVPENATDVKGIANIYGAMLETLDRNRRSFPPLANVIPLGSLFMDYSKRLTEDQYRLLIAFTIPHISTFLDELGVVRHRLYVEFLFRHQASSIFRTVFGQLTHRDHYWLFDAVKGRTKPPAVPSGQPVGALNPATASSGTATAAAIKEARSIQLARKLAPFIFKLFNTSQSWVDHFGNNVSALFTSELEKIKIFDQHVRGATSSAVQMEHGKLKVILVGDASRDSYYAFGNSVNSAFTALAEHLDDLLANSGPAFDAAAQAYHKQLVDDFVDFIGADIYYRCFCGCDSSASGVHKKTLKKLRFGKISCPDGEDCSFPRTFSSDATAVCGTQSAAVFKESTKKICEPAALQNILA